MKKLISVLLLACMLVMPFAAMAEAPVITWDEVGAAAVEAYELSGDFVALEELGLTIWVAEGMEEQEVSDEDAAAGRLCILADDSCALTVDAVHVDGMTLDQALENAKASGMFEPEIVNVNGLSALSYKNEAINAGCVVLVDTNSNMIIFSFTPIEGEAAQIAFTVIMSSLMPLE